MTDLRQAAQQALDALNTVVADVKTTPTAYETHRQAITALKAALAAPQPEPVSHAVIAGALFDFMAWLTTRKERLVLSSTDNASPAVESITEFAKMRGLLLDDAKVRDWNTTPPQRQPLNDLYNELLFAVGNKYPNETRHQTALRYLKQAEATSAASTKAHGIGGAT